MRLKINIDVNDALREGRALPRTAMLDITGTELASLNAAERDVLASTLSHDDPPHAKLAWDRYYLQPNDVSFAALATEIRRVIKSHADELITKAHQEEARAAARLAEIDSIRQKLSAIMPKIEAWIAGDNPYWQLTFSNAGACTLGGRPDDIRLSETGRNILQHEYPEIWAKIEATNAARAAERVRRDKEADMRKADESARAEAIRDQQEEAKSQFIAAWVSSACDAELIEQHAAGLLCHREAVSMIADAVLNPLGMAADYTMCNDPDHHCGPCEITCLPRRLYGAWKTLEAKLPAGTTWDFERVVDCLGMDLTKKRYFVNVHVPSGPFVFDRAIELEG